MKSFYLGSKLSFVALLSTSLWGVELETDSRVFPLEPFTVTAYHYPSLSVETPAVISRLNQADIRDGGIFSVSELLNRQPGIQVQNLNGNEFQGGIAWRGFSAGGNQRTLVLVDGLPWNRPDMAAINWGMLPPSQIEQVEVIRGAQSVLYGNTAVAGVIKIQSRQPLQPVIAGRLGAGSYNSYFADLFAVDRMGNGAVRLQYTHFRSDGYRENSSAELSNFGLGMELPVFSGWVLDFKLNRSNTDYELPDGIWSVDFPDDPRISTNPGQYARERFWQTTVRLREQRGDGLGWEISSGYRHSNGDWSTWGVPSENVLETFRQQVRHSRRIENMTVLIGVDAQIDDLELDQLSPADPAHVTGRGNVSRDSLAGYGHVDIELSENLRLATGARLKTSRLKGRYLSGSAVDPSAPLQVEFDDSNRDQQAAGLLGLNWKPAQNLRVWTRADRLYRLPAFDEVATYQGFLLDVPFNDQLKAERGWNYELGASTGQGNWLLETSVFETRLDNEIYFDPTVFLNQNLSESSTRRGLESFLTYTYGSGRISGGATWLHSRLGDSDHRLPLVPGTTYQLEVEQHFADQWVLRVDANYVGKRHEGDDFDNSIAPMPSHLVWNIHLGWQPVDGHRLTLHLLNAANEQYATIRYYGMWYPEPGRNIRASWHWEF